MNWKVLCEDTSALSKKPSTDLKGRELKQIEGKRCRDLHMR
jgi:hypothetical protein